MEQTAHEVFHNIIVHGMPDVKASTKSKKITRDIKNWYTGEMYNTPGLPGGQIESTHKGA